MKNLVETLEHAGKMAIKEGSDSEESSKVFGPYVAREKEVIGVF